MENWVQVRSKVQYYKPPTNLLSHNIGEILARDIIQLLPFYTLLSSLRVTGKDLKVVLNAMLKGTRNPDGTFGGSG